VETQDDTFIEARLVVRVDRSLSEHVQCQVCGALNPPDSIACGACGVALGDAAGKEKIDALLDDLLDMSAGPEPDTGPPPVVEEAPDVDEAVAEELFDSLLVEIQPRPGAPAEPQGTGEESEVGEVSEESEAPGTAEGAAAAEAVERIPIVASPGDAESGKLLRVSGRMFDLVTFGSGAALVAVFAGLRMYENPFGNPLPTALFGGIAAGGMVAALILFHVSNSEVAQGDRLVKQGRYEEALRHYERAIRMVRRPSYAWTSRGVALKYLGRLDDALRCHENAIRLDPENEVAWCNLGTVYFKKGELGKAIECYDKAIHLRPKYAIAWNNKGVVLSRMNQFAEADRCHAKATTLRPEYVAAWLNRGEVLARLGAPEEAQRCLEKARSISRSAAA
jgi:Flp pilus assembly protein TadD